MSLITNILIVLCLAELCQQLDITFEHTISCRKYSNWCFYLSYREFLSRFSTDVDLARHGFHCWNKPNDEQFRRKSLTSPVRRNKTISVWVAGKHNCTHDGRIKSVTVFGKNMFDDGKQVTYSINRALEMLDRIYIGGRVGKTANKLLIRECQFERSCPIGKVLRIDESPDIPKCLANQIGYSHGSTICCADITPCTQTGMVSKFLHMRNRMPHYSLEKTEIHKLEDPPVWPILPYVFEVKKGDKEYLCHYHNEQSQLLSCETHKNCQIGYFCGDVVNFSFEAEIAGNCRPLIPEKDIMKMQYATFSNSSNFVLCDTNEDCNIGQVRGGYCHLELKGKNEAKWNGYVPDQDPTKIGIRKTFEGICMHAKPFAYIFSHIVDNLSPINIDTEHKKYLAVDMENDKYRDELHKCAKNKECAKGQFCGNIATLREDNKFDDLNAFCFKVPDVRAPYSPTTSYTVLPEAVGLIPCDTIEDCERAGARGIAFCDIGTKKKYPGSAGKLYNGLCVSAKICTGITNEYQEPFKFDMAELSSQTSNKMCETNQDCAGTVQSTTGDAYEGVCLKRKTLEDVYLCCYREVKRCSPDGKVDNPSLRCGKNSKNPFSEDGPFAECNGGLKKMAEQKAKIDNWCDMDSNQCCQHRQNAYCPDKQTPLFQEPDCESYDKTKPESGKCVGREGAICHHGHCCPNATIDTNGIYKKSERSYITNQPCTVGVRPQQFTSGYCDPNSKKVVIIGTISPDGSPFQPWPAGNPKECVTDSDCSTDTSIICLYEEVKKNSKAHCYKNPIPLEESSAVIIIVLIITLIVIIILIALGGFLFYKFKMKKDVKKSVEKVQSPTTLTSPIETRRTI